LALHWRHPRERRRADVPKPSRPLPRGYHAKALGVLVRTFANEHQIPEARARLWVSYIALGGALERTNAKSSAPIYVIKGGVALELRLRERARATKDIDISVRVDRPDLIDHFTAAIAARFEGFTFRRRSEPYVMPNGSVRLDIAVSYHDGSWNTIQVDLSSDDGTQATVDLVEATSAAQLGLPNPVHLSCLSVPYQIAQKLHGMTEPRSADRRANDRFRDLFDVLLLTTLIEDLAALGDACDDVFRHRATHAWPGTDLTLPVEWRNPYEALAREVGGVSADFDLAVASVREFITLINAARSAELGPIWSGPTVAHSPAVPHMPGSSDDDDGRMRLFREYNDRVILDPRFESLWQRMRFLRALDAVTLAELRGAIEDLQAFVASLAMSSYYAPRLARLVAVTPVHGPLEPSLSADEVSGIEAEALLSYRRELAERRTQIEKLIIEAAHQQPWAEAGRLAPDGTRTTGLS
jgi:hypothetical protein